MKKVWCTSTCNRPWYHLHINDFKGNKLWLPALSAAKRQYICTFKVIVSCLLTFEASSCFLITSHRSVPLVCLISMILSPRSFLIISLQLLCTWRKIERLGDFRQFQPSSKSNKCRGHKVWSCQLRDQIEKYGNGSDFNPFREPKINWLVRTRKPWHWKEEELAEVNFTFYNLECYLTIAWFDIWWCS